MTTFVHAKNFIKALPLDEQQAIKTKAKQLKQAYAIAQLRQQANLSQQQLAEKMGVSQANVSKIENGKDVYLSTLKRYIESLGGEIHINATMPNGECITIA